MASLIVTIVTCFLIHNIRLTSSAKILAIVPMPSYSHQVVYHTIIKNLISRGHHITLITPDPLIDTNLQNYTQIDISHSYNFKKELNFVNTRGVIWLKFLEHFLYDLSNKVTKCIFDHYEFKKIYAPDSNEKFDLVMVEAAWTPAFYVFGHRFNAPLIGIFSSGLTQMAHFVIGNPIIPSHPSSFELNVGIGLNLPFWKKVNNFISTWWHINVISYYKIYKPQQEIAEKYLGNIPSIRELEKNISIILANQPEEISFSRPNVPNVIYFSGLHIKDNTTSKSLPKELKEFMDNASNGFIYVSFGTNVQMSMLSNKLLNIFIDVFSKLPMRILWKFKGNISKIPNNTYIAPWFSQQKILAHPNLKLFVYQGGLQSTEEAIHFGIPLVGIPIIADQDMQVLKLESLGVCRRIDILQMTRESLNEAIMDVLNNKSYKENIIKLRNLIKDKPYDMMEKVIWWIEYIIRHKGAPHLRSSIVDEPWYQRYNTDVIAILSVILFIITILSLYIGYKIFMFIIKYYKTSIKNNKDKKNKLNKNN